MTRLILTLTSIALVGAIAWGALASHGGSADRHHATRHHFTVIAVSTVEGQLPDVAQSR